MSEPVKDPRNPADGKHVVIQNGQRASAPMTQQEAQAEADRRNKMLEAGGQPKSDAAKVKVNLFG